jgi:hypothetical protein
VKEVMGGINDCLLIDVFVEVVVQEMSTRERKKARKEV